MDRPLLSRSMPSSWRGGSSCWRAHTSFPICCTAYTAWQGCCSHLSTSIGCSCLLVAHRVSACCPRFDSGCRLCWTSHRGLLWHGGVSTWTQRLECCRLNTAATRACSPGIASWPCVCCCHHPYRTYRALFYQYFDSPPALLLVELKPAGCILLPFHSGRLRIYFALEALCRSAGWRFLWFYGRSAKVKP